MMLPPASSSLRVTPLDFIEDVTGTLSSVDEGTQSVTLQTATRGPITAIANNSTIVSPNCVIFNLGNTFTRAKQGQVASLDTVLNPDGSVTLVEYDPLAITAGDWLEGPGCFAASPSPPHHLVYHHFFLAAKKELLRNNFQFGAY